MAPKNVLVVTTVVADDEQLRDEIRPAVGGEGRIRIVAPAAKVSRLQWLTNEEDEARDEARRAAEQAAGALGGEAAIEVDRASHDTDAVQAVSDALRAFDADEIVVVTRPGDDSSWLEDETARASFEEFGVPVRRVEMPETSEE
jgi:ABC-type branched-subunit amino acid transport system substrate-binding protein